MRGKKEDLPPKTCPVCGGTFKRKETQAVRDFKRQVKCRPGCKGANLVNASI